MMGWAMFGGIALAAALVLVVLRYPARLWTVPAAAIMLGAAGYVWQGSPGLPGRPATASKQKVELDQDMIDLRDAMFGKYGTYAWAYATQADAVIRAGSPELAVLAWQGAVRKVPEDVALWTGFGAALAEHDGSLSPAAQYAFDKAMALSPRHPGPPFFYAQALLNAGRLEEARPWLEKAVALTPATATYHRELTLRLLAVDLSLAAREGREPAPAR